MEQLFAVRVLVHYHDKSSVDHAAVRKLLSVAAVDTLDLLLNDGTTLSLSSYLQTPPHERKSISEVSGSSGSSLTQVASVFMLAEARAAVDALPASPHELETACSALERLLGCLATKRPLLPVRDIKQSARVKFGTAARRRAVHQLSRSGSDSNDQQVAILKAVNATLRLCDVATHCLAVVSRQSVSSRTSCETAVALSTRLLTLAASLYEVQKEELSPALSFSSSNSLRTALVAGAMHLGAITIEHLEIEPMTWIHVANHIVMSSSTSIAPRTSVLSALFGGMIKTGKMYEASERDSKAAEGAVCLLSTLHVVLETDLVRDSQDDGHESDSSISQSTAQIETDGSQGLSIGTGAISQAARSFLGERVVAAEEDGDEGRIAARTVYQACEEYAERAGESDGMMGLLARLFSSAGRQCRCECADEPVVSISEGTLTCHPDESDASSDGAHVRSESLPFTMDVFDQRSKDGFGASATLGSTSEAGADNMDRIELHREVAALSLDTLAHWVSRAPTLRRYTSLDMTAFTVNVCRSASFFSLGKSPASYDLRAAMVDFGSLIGPTLRMKMDEFPEIDQRRKWATLVATLTRSCHKMNPILKSVLSATKHVIIMKSLMEAFVSQSEGDEPLPEPNADTCRGLAVEDLLDLLMSLLTEENAVDVIDALSSFVRGHPKWETSDSALAYKASCLTLLSRAILVSIGIQDNSDTSRVALAALYNRDVDSVLDPVFPQDVTELTCAGSQDISGPRPQANRLLAHLHGIGQYIDKMCCHPSFGSWEMLSELAVKPSQAIESGREAGTQSAKSAKSAKNAKLLFHLYWSCVRLHKALEIVAKVAPLNFRGLSPSMEDLREFPLSSPFVCMKALESNVFNDLVMQQLQRRQKSSIPLLYTAECLALLHPQSGMGSAELKAFPDQGLPLLLASLVKNVVDVASDYVCGDIASSFKSLQRTFRKDLSLDFGERGEEDTDFRPHFCSDMKRVQSSFACLQLAMSYMRDIGSNQIAQLLGTVMNSATYVLGRFTPQQLLEARDLMFEVTQFLLFLPDSFGKLGISIFRFLKLYLSLSFPNAVTDTVKVEEMVVFLARVSGFSKIVELASSSGTGIHQLCKFAHDSGSDTSFDSGALQVSLTPKNVPEKFGSEFSVWLKVAVPTVTLSEMLSKLLVPPDDSAVAVSAHSQSLSLLTEACESSTWWQHAVLSGLNELFLDNNACFPARLVRRSVIESITMNESVLMIFERIVGTSDSASSAKVLSKVFTAACGLFEDACHSNLDSRVRLLTFAVRLAISYGRSSRRSSTRSLRSLLEPTLFELTISSLLKMTQDLEPGAVDPSTKQTILFLCGLIDCFVHGLYGSSQSYFALVNDDTRSAARNLKHPTSQKEDLGTGDDLEHKSSAASIPADSDVSPEESVKSTCTYNTTGSQFVEQHWYFCYSCDLTGSEGVCPACARICHSECELAYSKFSRFFCDCGAGSDPQRENVSNAMSASEDGDAGNAGEQDTHSQSPSSMQPRKRKLCKCLKSPNGGDRSPRSADDAPDRKLDKGSDYDQDVLSGTRLRELLVSEIRAAKEDGPKSDVNEVPWIQESFERVMKSPRTARCLIRTALLLVKEIDASHVVEEAVEMMPDVSRIASFVRERMKNPDHIRLPKTTKLVRSTRVFRAGSLDMSGMIVSGEIPQSLRGSLISYSSINGILVVGRKGGLLEFVDASDALLQSGNPLEKSAATGYLQTSVPHDIIRVSFHCENPNLLLVVGSERLSILARVAQTNGCRWSHLEIELGLAEYDGYDGFNALLDACWVEGEAALVLVTTTNFVKIFDAAADTFCPCLFATTPRSGDDLEDSALNQVVEASASAENPDTSNTDRKASDTEQPESPDVIRVDKRTVQAAFGISRLLESDSETAFFLVLVTSDNKVWISRSRWNETSEPVFCLLCDVQDTDVDDDQRETVSGVFFHPTESLVIVSYNNGSLLCLSVALKAEEKGSQASIRWMHMYRDAIPSGENIELIPVPGLESTLMFYRKGKTLKAGGVLSISTDRSVRVHCFSGSPSASVLGLAAFASSSVLGRPAFAGGFLLLDDGSLLRADILSGPPRPQTSDESLISNVIERQRVRALRAPNASCGSQDDYRSVPKAVGFFEKCRLIPEQFLIEVVGSGDSDPSYERMGVELAGGTGDSVSSPKENEPFKFTASVDNQSIVLVGARLQFGGTEHSRNRVPAEVKVFERLVKWQSRNGIKRWLDIPFSVPESTASPQKAIFELFPRRSRGDSRVAGDGFLAIDALELYSVSTIEFTERKLLFENEKSKHFEQLKKKKESPRRNSSSRYASLLRTPARSAGTREAGFQFSPDQSALLTVLNSVDSGSFSSDAGKNAETGALVLEINNLWSAVFEGSQSRDPFFLEHVLQAILGACAETEESDGADEFCVTAKNLLAKAVKASTEGKIDSVLSDGVLLHVNNIERSLFAVAGLGRSLLIAGSSVGSLASEIWTQRYDESMPTPRTIILLLSAHYALGLRGRSLYKSSHSASGNAVDIFVALFVRLLLESEKQSVKGSFSVHLLIQMLSSLDQRLRLFVGQRLLELFDSVETAAKITGSPLESLTSTSFGQDLKAMETADNRTVSQSSEVAHTNDDADSARWAYRCDNCGEVCDQEWWHCNECEDFDLCIDCLRKPGISFHGSHNENHLLLRGTASDDLSDQHANDGYDEVSDIDLAIQKILGPVLDELLSVAGNEKNRANMWRYLDGAETIAQLVGKRCPPALRNARLKALFASSFPSVLCQESMNVGAEIESSTNEQSDNNAVPRNAEVLFLVLRIISCAKGGPTPAYLHEKNIPGALVSLLRKMHIKLQALVRSLSSGYPRNNTMSCEGSNLISWETWNIPIPDLAYDILPRKRTLKHLGKSPGLFYVNEELGLADSVFLNLLIATLEVLEYSFKSASSASILDQMRLVPRNVLCDVINISEAASPHLQNCALFKESSQAATRVLSALEYDDVNALNDTLDKYLYKEQCSRLKDAVEALNGPTDQSIDYNALVEIATILETLHKAAVRHPSTWRSYVIDHDQVLRYIYDACRLSDGQIRVNALQLLAAGVAVSEAVASKAIRGLSVLDLDQRNQSKTEEDLDSPNDAGRESSFDRPNELSPTAPVSLSRASQKSDQVPLSIFQEQNLQVFDFLVHNVMLRCQDEAARTAASHVFILGIVRAAAEVEETFICGIHRTLLKGIELMPYAGDLADGLMECLRFFIDCCQNELFGMQSQSLLTGMSSAVTSLLKHRCNVLVSHPNARLYGRLSAMLDIHGYYLESDPCMSCSASVCESSERRECQLDTIRAETKYTDCSVMHRLVSIHEVSAVSVKVIDPRRSRRVKTIEVLFSSRTVSDAAELKSADHPWRKLRSLELGPNATEACIDLVVPIAAANIKLEFVEFHTFDEVPLESTRDGRETDNQGLPETTNPRRSNPGSAGHENLQCPRCSRSVTDRHGICRNCHENAYQCRHCRNINYENLDGFLCNECGYCKHGRFEFSLTGRPTFVAERILNEEDRKRASKIIEKETGNVHRCMDQLKRMRSSIIRSLNSGIPTEETRERSSRPIGSARVGLGDLLDSVPPRADYSALEVLLEQGHAPQEIEEAANSTHGGISITEEVIAESSGSADQSERDQNNATGSGHASPVRHNGHSRSSHSDRSIISKSTSALAASYAKECRTIYTSMSRGIRLLTLTRSELVRYANTVGGSRLQYADDIVSDESRENLDHHRQQDQSGPGQKECSKPVPSHKRVACYGCTQSFVSKCVRLVQNVMRREGPASAAIRNSDLAQYMLLVCSLCEKAEVRSNIRDVITYLVRDNLHATQLVCKELTRKIEFCIDSFETVDAHSVARFEMAILEATATLDDACWEERLKLVIRILFKASTHALTCSSVSESIILPCLRVALRLMRADTELTVIANVSAVDNLAGTADAGSNEGLHPQASDNGEAENLDFPQSRRENGRPQNELGSDRQLTADMPENSRNLAGVSNATLNVEIHSDNMAGHGDGPAPSGARDQLRSEDRRQSPRAGSDFLPGSGAPSSIGTAFDGHLSDDDVSSSVQRQEAEIDVRTINTVLENDHDSKLLSADVGQWLEGKLDQTSWIAEMKERSTQWDDGSAVRGSLSPTYLKAVLSKWKRVGQESRTASSSTKDPFVREDSQVHKRLSIEKDNWIVRLMLFTPCATVRKEACALLELICGQEESLRLQLLDVLTGPALSLGANAGENSKEFFDLLEATLSSRSHRLYLIAKGFLSRLAELIRARSERLIMFEANSESSLQLVNFLEGYSVKRLLSLLRQTLDAIPSERPSLREKLFEVNDYKLVGSLERAYICVRKLISLRTRLTDDCGSQLCEILLSRDFLFTGPTVSAIVSACVTELRSAKEKGDAQAIAILLEQLCLMLCPERKEPICFLALNQAPTQEEFIRGSMSRNPYPSSAFDGPLMRDVKNKICKDLDLPGLLEDDFAMELLVAGNLVKLDLPIMGVYNHVWRGSAAASMASSMQPTQITRSFGIRRASHSARGGTNGTRPGGVRSTILTFRRLNSERDSEDESRLDVRTEPPMVVVYRLSGLDGEATEPIVDSVPAESADEQDAEELYGDTIIFGEVGGLDVLFELLAIVGSWGDDAETAVRAPALRLLRASCEVAKNRALLAKSPDAVRTLLDCAASAFEHAQGSPAAVTSAESLLVAAEQILAQQRKELETHTTTMSDAVSVSSHDPEEVISRVQVFLGRLSVATSPKAENSILHLLPFLVQGVPGAIDLVLNYFHFSWDTIDIDDEGQRKARQLGTVLLATPNDLRGDKFAEQTIRTDVGLKSVEYVVQMFPVPRSTHKADWMAALDCPGPPLMLRLLTGLSLFLASKQGQQRAGALLRNILQKQIKIVPVLCQLEMAVSVNAIGTTAEGLLDALAKDPHIRREIEGERDTIKRARRKAAKASRMAILRETGLTKLAPGEACMAQAPVEQAAGNENKGVEEESVQKLMDELPDEAGPSCVVCGDGFRCRPEEALAFYVYCRKVPLELSTGPYAAQGPKPNSDMPCSSDQGSGHVDLDAWPSGRSRSNGNLPSRSGGTSCYASVTHLNAIHLSCHKEAARADRSSRRDEWEGAALRNSQTKCNNLFPVRPPVTLENELTDAAKESNGDQAAILKSARVSFSAAADSYFGRLSSLGRTSLPHAKAVTYDIGRCLLRFADGGTAVFSEHSKGGGPHSNACLLPHLIQLAIYMVEVSPQNDPQGKSLFNESKTLETQEAALLKFLEEDEVGDITYYLASALVLQSLEKWKICAVLFLRRGLRDGVLKNPILFRLIAFADLVNRVLKGGILLKDEQHWLDGLRKHIGADETFAQVFGDSANEKWEEYIRSVTDGDSLLVAITRNAEVGNGHEPCEDDKVLLSGLRECLGAD